VAQLIDIFAFLSVLLRGLTLASEALTVGGVFFLSVIVREPSGSPLARRLLRLLTGSSVLLCLTQISYVALNSAVLVHTANVPWTDVKGAAFCVAGAAMILGAALVVLSARIQAAGIGWPIGCASILCGSVMTSHAAARLDQRWAMAGLTLAHQLATAAWIGGMPYLLISLRRTQNQASAVAIAGRFSKMALLSVAILISAGVAMAAIYVGSPDALIGTAYGAMLLSKAALAAVLLLLGALNFSIVRAARSGGFARLPPLQRFAEAEIGIGLTVILAAASLTSSPPANDVHEDRVTLSEIAQRMRPVWPLLETPKLSELSPATSFSAPADAIRPESYVPGQRVSRNTPADIAWSEYNHHWSGLVVLSIGLLSALALWLPWARNWPLCFFGLAAFLFVRADSENWPLGPRGFWESFQVAEVAQHRVFVLLIIIFAVFEWAVQTGRISSMHAKLVFPVVCAAGGALLLTHSHSLGNVKEEFLAELSHLPLAILGIVAGWSRWLEIRLPQGYGRVLKWIWPICFLLIGGILLNYREA
jgi:copper resistance protein D